MADTPASDGKFRDLDRDVEMVAHAHQRLLAALDVLVDDDALDVAAPSTLPGWTRGHVLTHLTNSGRGHSGIFQAAARSESVAQYPNGLDGRAADIRAGAARAAGTQRDDLRRSIYELEGDYARSKWVGTGRAPSGDVSLIDLPWFRLREVAIHHVDLDIGYGFDDLPSLYVDIEVRRLEERWASRQAEAGSSLPAAATALAPPARLAWLTGRLDIEGLASSAIF